MNRSFTFFGTLTILLFSVQFASAIQWFWRATSGNNASIAANWHNGGCLGTNGNPGTNDTIVFTLCSGSSTSCTIDANMTVKMVDVRSNYASTISMNTGVTLTMAVGSFRGGTFTGSTGAITCTSSFTLDGAAFTSSSGTFTNIGTFSYKSGTFSANSGTILFKKGSASITVITGPTGTSPVNLTTITFYKVEFSGDSSSNTFDFRNITPTVTNELKISGSNPVFINSQSGTIINVTGNITSANSATTGGGGIYLVVNGTGSQSITDSQGAGISGKLPNVTIDKSGTLSLVGTIGLGGSATWRYTAGIVSEGTAKLICFYNDSIVNASGGTMKFYDLEMQGNGGSHTIINTITVDHTFSTSQTGVDAINGGTLELDGDVTWSNTATASFGNVTMKFAGTTADTITASIVPQFYNMTINKTGTVTLQHEVKVTNALTLTNGYLITDTTNLLDIANGASTSGASSSSFVRGAIKKIGNSSFTFPIGKDSVYRPIGITAPSSSTDAFRAEYIHSPQSLGTAKDSLTYISACEYWSLKRTTGSSNVKVSLYWDTHTCDIYVAATLRIGYWNGSLWHNTGPVTTSGSLSSGNEQNNSNLSSFGYFTICKRSPAVYAHTGTDTTFCRGGTKTLGASTAGSGGIGRLTYSWSPPGGLSSTSTAHPTAIPTFTTYYILAVIDSDHSFAFDTAKITISQTPFVDAGPDRIVCGNDSIRIGGEPTSADMEGSDTIVWKVNGTYLSSESNPLVGVSSSANYIVTVTNQDDGCSAKDTTHLTADPALNVNAGRDTTVIIGYSSLTLGSSPTASGGKTPYAYSWLPTTNVSSATTANPTTSYSFSKTYHLIVTDSFGCVNQDDVAVTVKPPSLLTAKDYGILSGHSVTVQHADTVQGRAGAISSISSSVVASDGKYVNTTGVQTALADLDTAINHFNALPATSINYNLSGQSYGAGVYSIDSFALLNDTLELHGDQTSYFIFLIRDSLVLKRGAYIDNNTGDPGRVYFIVNKKLIAHNLSNIEGNILVKDSIKGDTINGPTSLHSLTSIKISGGSGIRADTGLIPLPFFMDPVKHIEAWSWKGQTFITWAENTTISTRQIKYTIYRYPQQINGSNYGSATKIGYVLQRSGFNKRWCTQEHNDEYCLADRSFYNYTIPRANGSTLKLGSDTGLFVITNSDNTHYWYAVTDDWNSYSCPSDGSGCEVLSFIVADKNGNNGNSTMGSVSNNLRNGVPQPYLQLAGDTSTNGVHVDTYTQYISTKSSYTYVDHNSNTDYYYPPMVNDVNSYLPFNFCIHKPSAASGTTPLDVVLHGDAGSFLTSPTTSADNTPTMISLYPDDYLPVIDPIQDGQSNIKPSNYDNTGWGGYNECYDVYTQGLQYKKNPVPDSIPIPPINTGCLENVAFSSNRVLYTIKYLVNNPSFFLSGGVTIDSNQIIAEGGSGGGIGCYFLALFSPGTFAAVESTVPKLNLSFALDEPVAHKWKFCSGKLRNQTDEKLGAFSSTYCNTQTCSRYSGDPNLSYLLPEDKGTIGTYYATNAAYFIPYTPTGGTSLENTLNTPLIYVGSGRNDTTMGWEDKAVSTTSCGYLGITGQDGIYTDLRNSKFGGFYFWDTRDHGGNILTDGLKFSDWDDRFRYIRRNESFPAFSNTINIEGQNSGVYRGWQALPTSDDGTIAGEVDYGIHCTPPNGEPISKPYFNGDCIGSVNGFLDWYDRNGKNSHQDTNSSYALVDSPNVYKIWITTRDLHYYSGSVTNLPVPLAKPASCVTDVTLRRIQQFGQGTFSGTVYYEVIDGGGSGPLCGHFTYMHGSPITIPDLTIDGLGATEIWLSKASLCPERNAKPSDSNNVIAFPNPFETTTNIKVNLTRNALTTIFIYDLSGRLVKSISEGELQPGKYQFNVPFESWPAGAYIAIIYLNEKRYPLMLVKSR